MLKSILFRLSFAQRLLLVVIAINLLGGIAIVAKTAHTQLTNFDVTKKSLLIETMDLLQIAMTKSLPNLDVDQRTKMLDLMSPVLESNPELDLFGLVRQNGVWGLKAWTRDGGDDSMKDVVSPQVIEELIANPATLIVLDGMTLMSQPIMGVRRGTTERGVVAYAIGGHYDYDFETDILPQLRGLAQSLGLLVLAQLIVVGLYLEIKVRRPLQRVSERTAEIEGEHVDLANEFANLSEIDRVERAITLLGQSREQYRQQEANLRSILTNIKEGILVLDSSAKIVEVNHEFVSIWGYAPAEIIGQPVWEILHSDDQNKIREDMDNYAKTQFSLADKRMQLTAVDMSGKSFPIDFIYSYCVVGKQSMFVVAVNDISEQQQRNEELVIAKEKAEVAKKSAEDAAAAKAAFLANMSHEIRTPMNGVMGLLDLVADSNLKPQQRALVSTAKVSAESLLNVLNDILDISKIEAGKVDLEMAEFDIRPLIEDVVLLFQVAAIEKGLELNCFIDPAISTFFLGDSTRIRQIVSNVVGNAVKFTQAGEVDVQLVVEAEESEETTVKISVRDTGIGMSAEAIDVLFDHFTQADESTTRKFGGTGLGMAISKQLVELMDGSISAKSKLGIGTTFEIELRLRKGDERKGLEFAKLPRTKVLLVDDNQTSRDIIAAYFRAWNVRYQCAANAEEAIALVEGAEESFDICLADYHMPQVDGIELTKVLKNRPDTAHLSLAVLGTAAIDASRLHAAGIRHSLSKPIRQVDLFQLIAKCRDLEFEEEQDSVVPSANFDGMVLLVEDNKVNRLVAKSLLEKMGLIVEVALDGVEALTAMASKQYDLVFMDCLMPNLDGYEATRQRRQQEKNQQLEPVTIIALTANAMSGDRELCLEAGMDDFLSKPIEIEDLREKIDYWLSAVTLPT